MIVRCPACLLPMLVVTIQAFLAVGHPATNDDAQNTYPGHGEGDGRGGAILVKANQVAGLEGLCHNSLA